MNTNEYIIIYQVISQSTTNFTTISNLSAAKLLTKNNDYHIKSQETGKSIFSYASVQDACYLDGTMPRFCCHALLTKMMFTFN